MGNGLEVRGSLPECVSDLGTEHLERNEIKWLKRTQTCKAGLKSLQVRINVSQFVALLVWVNSALMAPNLQLRKLGLCKSFYVAALGFRLILYCFSLRVQFVSLPSKHSPRP